MRKTASPAPGQARPARRCLLLTHLEVRWFASPKDAEPAPEDQPTAPAPAAPPPGGG